MHTEKFFENWLITKISQELSINISDIRIDIPLHQLGLDSQAAISISGELELLLNERLNPTVLFEYPTILELAPYLASIAQQNQVNSKNTKNLDFTLFFFALKDPDEGKYELMKQAARYADENGFKAIWIPERHFNVMGGNFPNPAVISAALAMITQQISLRAGSVVLPLHDPIRVVEEWSVVDQLSKGRVELSFASGWHVDDFVLAPEKYNNRKEILFDEIATVQALWRGKSLLRNNGHQKSIAIECFPKPIQRELPIWITAIGNAETFKKTAEMNANLLTCLLTQDLNELTEKIKIYRGTLEQNNFPHKKVSLFLHTYVGETPAEARATVTDPFRTYLRGTLDLLGNFS